MKVMASTTEDFSRADSAVDINFVGGRTAFSVIIARRERPRGFTCIRRVVELGSASSTHA